MVVNKSKKGGAMEIVSGPIDGETVEHVEVMTLEQRIKTELSRFDTNKQAIAKIKKQFVGLTINGVDDKEGYEKADTARKALKKLNSSIENRRKDIKSDYLETGRAIDTYATDLKTLVTTGAGGLDEIVKKLDEIDLQKEELDRQEKEAAEKKLNDRVKALESAGIKFDGRLYSLGDVALDINTIANLDEDRFNELVEVVSETKKRFDKEEEDRQEAERKRLDDINRQELENKQRQEDLDRKERELNQREAAAKKAINDGRARLLHGVGLHYDNVNHIYYLRTPSGNVEVTQTELESDDEQQWQTRSEGLQKRVREIQADEETRLKEVKDEEERKDQLAARNRARKAYMEGMGFTYENYLNRFIIAGDGRNHIVSGDEVYAIDDNNFSAFLEKTKSNLKDFEKEENHLRKARDEQQEKERKAGLSDAEKIEEYLKALGNVQVPQPTSPGGHSITAKAVLNLADLMEAARASLKELTK